MSREHLPALDGLRGVAILSVLAFHNIAGAHSGNSGIRAIAAVARFGWSGVTLFFILSGFLITRILWDSRNEVGWWKNFYMRRTLRIAPLYYGTLLLALIAASAVGQAHTAFMRLWIYALYLQNIPFFARIANDYISPLWLGHFWSLAVEEQFYLIWPLIITRAKTITQAKYLCLAVFLLSVVFRVLFIGRLGVEYNGFLPIRAGELAFGAYLSFCFRDHSWRVLERVAPIVFAAALVILFVGIVPSLLLALMTVLWGSFLVISLSPGVTSRMMSTPLLRWLGSISYGVYVFHVLFTPFYWWVARHIAPHSGVSVVSPIASAITVSLSLVLASISFRYFEMPFLRLRTRYHGKRAQLKTTIA